MVLLSNSQQMNRYVSTTATPFVAKSLASTTQQEAEAATGSNTTMTNEQGALLIVPFGGSAPPATILDKTVLGGKGVGLQTMGAIGIDVPPGFTLTTETCGMFQEKGGLPDQVWQGVLDNIRRVENDMGGRKFGDAEQMPLLLSCRSGAAISMPGMMDTVLNVGLNSDTVQALAKATNNPKFAYDSFRRLLDMLGDVVS
jgi:pyruvate, orthophosphate dikinase